MDSRSQASCLQQLTGPQFNIDAEVDGTASLTNVMMPRRKIGTPREDYFNVSAGMQRSGTETEPNSLEKYCAILDPKMSVVSLLVRAWDS